MESGRSGPSPGNDELLKQLLEYVIKVLYPQVIQKISISNTLTLIHGCKKTYKFTGGGVHTDPKNKAVLSGVRTDPAHVDEG